MTIADRFLAWTDKRNIVSVRSFTLYVTVWMTWEYAHWAMEFGTAWLTSNKPGVELAAIIGAVGVPITALQGFVFSNYTKVTKATS